MDVAMRGLPFFIAGTVVKGFGRGSKELGIPTANLPQEVVDNLPDTIENGIYFGWANVDNSPVHKMVMSVGWNPYYKNVKRSMECFLFQETHLIHTFSEDFYGSLLKVCMLGYIRPEKNFKSLDELISAIKCDIETAQNKLDSPEYQAYKNDPFFRSKQSISEMVDGVGKGTNDTRSST